MLSNSEDGRSEVMGLHYELDTNIICDGIGIQSFLDDLVLLATRAPTGSKWACTAMTTVSVHPRHHSCTCSRPQLFYSPSQPQKYVVLIR